MPLIDRWFPVSRSEEVLPRQIVQAQLLDQEVVVWRDDSGSVNTWENRCPHRGVRLSIGCNTGTELHCRYHGWRFAAGSGQCTHIPAHPSQRPAAAIRAVSFACREQSGFVWVNLGTALLPLPMVNLDTTHIASLRSVHVAAAAPAIAGLLQQEYSLAGHDEFVLTPDPADAALGALTFLLQPMAMSQTVIHGFLHESLPSVQRVSILRQHNERLTALRDAAESGVRAARQ